MIRTIRTPSHIRTPSLQNPLPHWGIKLLQRKRSRAVLGQHGKQLSEQLERSSPWNAEYCCWALASHLKLHYQIQLSYKNYSVETLCRSMGVMHISPFRGARTWSGTLSVYFRSLLSTDNWHICGTRSNFKECRLRWGAGLFTSRPWAFT